MFVSRAFKNVFLLNTPIDLHLFYWGTSAAALLSSWAFTYSDVEQAGVLAYVVPAILLTSSVFMSVMYRITHANIVTYAHGMVIALTAANPVMFDRRDRPVPLTKSLLDMTQVNNAMGGFSLAIAANVALYVPIAIWGITAMSRDPVFYVAITALLNYALGILVSHNFMWRFEQRKFAYLYRAELDNQFAPKTRTNHNPKR